MSAVSETDSDGALLTTSEVANEFRVNRGTIARWFRNGQLPGVQVGKTLRFHRSDVERILTPKTNAAGSADTNPAA